MQHYFMSSQFNNGLYNYIHGHITLIYTKWLSSFDKNILSVAPR